MHAIIIYLRTSDRKLKPKPSGLEWEIQQICCSNYIATRIFVNIADFII